VLDARESIYEVSMSHWIRFGIGGWITNVFKRGAGCVVEIERLIAGDIDHSARWVKYGCVLESGRLRMEVVLK
jgi:hypothetical protein